MNIYRLTIFILIVCALFLVAARPVHAAMLYLVTQTVTPSPTGRTSTPSQTFTPTMTPSNTATTTLIPLPAITLIFPASTTTPTPTITTTPSIADETSHPQGTSGLNNLSARYRLLAVLIALLWLVLIGFAVLFIRQFK
jgi:hypothetical protein